MEIIRVQRWVASALTLTVAFVWAGGMVALALVTFDERTGAKIGVLVMAGVIGVAAMVGVRLINQLSWLSPWLLAGLLPTIGGIIAMKSQ